MATSGRPSHAALTEADVLTQIEAADRQPKTEEPTAKSIVFEPETRSFDLRLSNDTRVGFNADSLWELKGASPEELAAVELSPSGNAITWPRIDMDISVAGLVLDLLGSPEWKRALRRAVNRDLARIKSEATAKAARENGKKGGRPRKNAGQ
ncbi:MAG: DUF2442 domain-containing protein [Candidatus Sericytochromatia bacterium]|nr:DUF2442 domain-containing protein [Candidatus Tanganyikabacteria bacterium]